MIEEVKVSDLDTSGAKGIYDSQTFCNSVIVDVDEALKQIFSGERVGFCNTMIQIVRKMALLKDGIQKDLEAKDEQIRHYQSLYEESEGHKEQLIQEINRLNGKKEG